MAFWSLALPADTPEIQPFAYSLTRPTGLLGVRTVRCARMMNRSDAWILELLED